MEYSFIYQNSEELLELCKKEELKISQIAMLRENELTGNNFDEINEKMNTAWQIMKKAVRKAIDEDVKTMGGLIGNEAKKLTKLRTEEKNICGTVISKAIAYAMGVLEVNASMGLIVAAPTAGASGVIPGVFVAIQEEYGFDDSEMINALYNAGAIGCLISRNATVSGAEAGCQAEVGTASSMAASAVTELFGGTPEMCLSAASYAMSNLLGLVCDPILGLVEAPCQTRNSIGASGALVAAEIALSGIGSLIPFDEIVEAMLQVGHRLPPELRETAMGGIAKTPTACSFCSKMECK